MIKVVLSALIFASSITMTGCSTFSKRKCLSNQMALMKCANLLVLALRSSIRLPVLNGWVEVPYAISNPNIQKAAQAP